LKKLIALTLIVALTIQGFTFFSGSIVEAQTQSSEAQLLSYTWHISYASKIAEWRGDLVAIGEVQNTGTTTLSSVWLLATAYNSTGDMLDQINYKALAFNLSPEQKAPFFLDFLPEYSPTQDQSWVSSVTNVTVAIVSAIATSETMYSGLTLPPGSVTGFNNAGTYTVTGAIQNTGSQTTGRTWAVTTFYNSSGTVVALNYTSYLADSIAPGNAVLFTATPDDNTATLSSQIANYSVLIQTLPVESTATPTPKPTAPPTSTPSGTATQPPGTPNSDLTYPTIIAIAAVAVIAAALLLVRRRRRTQAPPSEGSTPSQKPAGLDNLKDDPAARLQNLKELLDRNLISKEDYEKKKNEILSQV
jgi:MYXO-CTERM domain-containing protein